MDAAGCEGFMVVHSNALKWMAENDITTYFYLRCFNQSSRSVRFKLN